MVSPRMSPVRWAGSSWERPEPPRLSGHSTRALPAPLVPRRPWGSQLPPPPPFPPSPPSPPPQEPAAVGQAPWTLTNTSASVLGILFRKSALGTRSTWGRPEQRQPSVTSRLWGEGGQRAPSPAGAWTALPGLSTSFNPSLCPGMSPGSHMPFADSTNLGGSGRSYEIFFLSCLRPVGGKE